MYNFLETFLFKVRYKNLEWSKKRRNFFNLWISILQSLALTSRTIKVVLKCRHFNILKNKLMKYISECKYNSWSKVQINTAYLHIRNRDSCQNTGRELRLVFLLSCRRHLAEVHYHPRWLHKDRNRWAEHWNTTLYEGLMWRKFYNAANTF